MTTTTKPTQHARMRAWLGQAKRGWSLPMEWAEVLQALVEYDKSSTEANRFAQATFGEEAYAPAPCDRSLQGVPLADVEGAGMTLRDYFAAAALTGIMSNENYILRLFGEGTKTVAGAAFGLANEMLKERAK